MRFYLISDNMDTLTGMRLAEIEGEVVHDPESVEKALNTAMAAEDIGIVLITELLVKLCPEQVSKMKQSCDRPLIVEIPDRHGSGRAKDSITRYVREAIGVKI